MYNDQLTLRKSAMHYLMLLPFFAVFGIFFLWPMVYGVAISFMKWNGIQPPKFIGLQNYVKVLSSPVFYASLKNLLIFTVSTLIIGISLSIFMAIIASQLSERMNYFYRAVFFLPGILPLALSAAIWKWQLAPGIGAINVLATKLGIPGVNWMTTPGLAIAAVVMVDFWRASGFNILILMVGIKEAPAELYEAARVDGANTLQKVRFVTIPQLEPIIFLIITNGFIGALQVFDIPWILSQSSYIRVGSVGNVMIYPVMQIFGLTFGNQKLGEASTYSVFLLLATLIITGIWFAVRRKKDI